MSEHPENYEDVTVFGLDADDEAEMLDAQNECTFIWSNKEGWPVGVIMSYVFVDGKFWLTASSQRARDQRRSSRSPGLHRRHVDRFEDGSQQDGHLQGHVHGPRRPRDQGLVLPGARQAIRGDDVEGAKVFDKFLDSPRRVILEVEPTQRIGYDGPKMGKATAEWMEAQKGAAS